MPERRSGRRPATTPKEEEDRVIAKAIREAERQIDSGKASSQVLTHYLKLGSTRERLEQTRLEHEIRLTEAKIDGMAQLARSEELMTEAIRYFRGYSGQASVEEMDDLRELED